MKPAATGRIVPTPDGRDLVLIRSFRADIEDVWASITEPERTARWFVTWSGDAAPGKTIRCRPMFEGDDAAGADMRIDACEAPRHLAVSMTDEAGTWRLEARLSQRGAVTTLEFVHHLDVTAAPGEVGPGWEYYLDMLVASRDDSPRPDFDDYFPSQQAYYEDLAREATDSG